MSVLAHIKPFVLAKSSFKKEVFRDVLINMFNRLVKDIIFIILIAIFPSSLGAGWSEKLVFFILFKFGFLVCYNIYIYAKSKHPSNMLSDELKYIFDLFCVTSYENLKDSSLREQLPKGMEVVCRFNYLGFWDKVSLSINLPSIPLVNIVSFLQKCLNFLNSEFFG